MSSSSVTCTLLQQWFFYIVSNEFWLNRIDPNVVNLLAIYGHGIWSRIIWRDFKYAVLIYPLEFLMHSLNLGA